MAISYRDILYRVIPFRNSPWQTCHCATPRLRKSVNKGRLPAELPFRVKNCSASIARGKSWGKSRAIVSNDSLK